MPKYRVLFKCEEFFEQIVEGDGKEDARENAWKQYEDNNLDWKHYCYGDTDIAEVEEII